MMKFDHILPFQNHRCDSVTLCVLIWRHHGNIMSDENIQKLPLIHGVGSQNFNILIK